MLLQKSKVKIMIIKEDIYTLKIEELIDTPMNNQSSTKEAYTVGQRQRQSL